jgi:hypothetical protein
MARLDGWIQGCEPSAPHDLEVAGRVSLERDAAQAAEVLEEGA